MAAKCVLIVLSRVQLLLSFAYSPQYLTFSLALLHFMLLLLRVCVPKSSHAHTPIARTVL